MTDIQTWEIGLKKLQKNLENNMSGQPYWQGKDCAILKGEMATDEEFAEVMKKLV